ncbi:Predicted arabinose efflux permease, MFS family [Chitinophaga rupis]|uniref:Predicted arabinose efflux permease, MFS family n=1 Tax=Chitinophaga rupis TaxID=573321 RepID=A0A1H7W7A1_9BACT|nr:MFS transporter [Chitinophaga rupis]SEM17416.1 Predicted arabinose efflux permease, MFS family [Chitinophaga rupis]
MKPSQLFRSLRSRNYRLYFTGQSISLIGTWMQRMAVSWLVYRLTHSSLMLGIVGFAGLIPSMLFSPYAGTLSDRHSRYKILLISQIASMIQSGVLAGLVLFKFYNITAIILLAIAQGIINAFDTTSRQSLMIDLIDNKEDLPNAIALNSSMVNLARLLGPAIAGVILSVFGEGICFLIDFLTFIAVIISLLMMRLQLLAPPKTDANIWEGLREGYVYLKQSPNIGAAIMMLGASGLFLMSFSTLTPVFAKEVFGGDAETYSWFASVTGLGALISAIYMAGLKPGKDLLKFIGIAAVVFGISVVLFSRVTSLPLALFFIMLSGAGMMGQIAATNTYVQTNVPGYMRGRMISYYAMAFQGTLPIGSLLTGLVAHHLGAPLTVCLQGTAGIICAGLFIWGIRRRRQAQAQKPTLEYSDIA